jgi:hydrogenase maturation factor
VTCGDEGILMRVLRVDPARRLAVCVKTGGQPWGREEIAIDLVEPVTRGQTLLVHAGVALANLDQTHASLTSLAAPEERSQRRSRTSRARDPGRAIRLPPERRA